MRLRGLSGICAPNGEEGKLVTYNSTNSRWSVKFDSDVFGEKLVPADNLEPLSTASLTALSAQVASELITCTEELSQKNRQNEVPPEELNKNQAFVLPEASATEIPLQTQQEIGTETLRWPIEASITSRSRDLEAALIQERSQELKNIGDVIVSSKFKADVLFNDVKELAETKKSQMEAFLNTPAPKTYEALQERNEARDMFKEEAESSLKKMETAVHAGQQPAEALAKATNVLLGQLDDAVKRLNDIKAETRRLLDEQATAVKFHTEKHQKQMVAMLPCMSSLDAFVKHYSKQVQEEAEQAIGDCKQQLRDLREREADFVKGNQSPTRNVAFSQLRKEMVSANTVLKEAEGWDDSRHRFLERWQLLCSQFNALHREKRICDTKDREHMKKPAANPQQRKRKWFFLW